MKDNKFDFAVGGQALIEGVMMRSPHFITMAVRRPSGEITIKKDPFNSLTQKVKLFSLPILRGIIGFFEMMVIGIKAFNFSANVSMEEEDEKVTEDDKLHGFGIVSLIFSVILSLAFALFLFKFLPLLLTQFIDKQFTVIQNNFWLFNLIDGVIKISFFLIYLISISLVPSIRRVFQYHGAEHKSIFTYEKGQPLTPEHTAKYPRFHPRCGTSFILIVFVISILFYTIIPRDPNFWIMLLERIAILPIIAGFSYEFLKASAKFQDNTLMHMVTLPGLWLQRLTTKEPDEKQLEIAIAALATALELEEKRPKDD